MPKALVIRTAGTNCDAELCRAFEGAGATAERVHVDRLIETPARIDEFDLIAFPGGFSYGDDVASGRILAMRVREHLLPALRRAADEGRPMIGVCNGFQVLVQTGLLPGWTDGADGTLTQDVSLAFNDHGRFVDRWVGVRAEASSPCVWTRPLVELTDTETMRLPIAHAEGRVVGRDAQVIGRLERDGQVALRYTDNPNGSTADIAGICDPTGRIFGLMPHPERYLDWTNHPFWTRLDAGVRTGETPGAMIFRAAVEAVTSPSPAM